jgi:molybdopterin-guanine dinucleotide biosynthesis protein
MKFANITLTDGQSQVILSKANKVDIGGPSYSGKTTINKILALMVAEQVPGAKIGIIRRTYKNLLNDYFKGGMSFENIIKAEVDGESTFKSIFTIDKSKLTVEFENGSKIYGFGCDNQEDVLKKLSEHYFDLIIVDEGLISSEIIEFSKTRLKVNSEIKDKFWAERLPRFQSSTRIITTKSINLISE